jgi:hypothetical protein
MTLTGPAKKQANARAASKRVAQLEAAAQRDGFETTSAALTAWKSSAYVLRRVDEPQVNANDALYMADLRSELTRLGVTSARRKRLDGLPLTAIQVAFAIGQYIIEIENRDAVATAKRKRTRTSAAQAERTE